MEKDSLYYGGTVYTIFATQGDDLFCPGDYGFSPRGISPAYRRGFWCRYTLKNGRLFLERFSLHDGRRFYPVFQNRKAKKGTLPGYMAYEELAIFIPFTGKLVVGVEQNKILSIRKAGNFSSPYARVKEFVFCRGRLLALNKGTGTGE